MKDKRFLGVTFKCCNVYSRIYINKKGDAFEGICPRCYKKRVVISIVAKGGTKSRFFDAG